jgi:hypothetical protein
MAIAVAIAVVAAFAFACHSERSEEPPHFARTATETTGKPTPTRSQ